MKAWLLSTNFAYLYSHLVMMSFIVFPQRTTLFPWSRGLSALPNMLPFITRQKASSNSPPYPPRQAQPLHNTSPWRSSAISDRASLTHSLRTVVGTFYFAFPTRRDGTQHVLVFNPPILGRNLFQPWSRLLPRAERKLQRLRHRRADPGLGGSHLPARPG